MFKIRSPTVKEAIRFIELLKHRKDDPDFLIEEAKFVHSLISEPKLSFEDFLEIDYRVYRKLADEVYKSLWSQEQLESAEKFVKNYFNIFYVAHNLGLRLEEVYKMSVDELSLWIAYFKVLNDIQSQSFEGVSSGGKKSRIIRFKLD